MGWQLGVADPPATAGRGGAGDRGGGGDRRGGDQTLAVAVLVAVAAFVAVGLSPILTLVVREETEWSPLRGALRGCSRRWELLVALGDGCESLVLLQVAAVLLHAFIVATVGADTGSLASSRRHFRRWSGVASCSGGERVDVVGVEAFLADDGHLLHDAAVATMEAGGVRTPSTG